MNFQISSKTKSEIFVPKISHSSCVSAYICRTTIGADLAHEQKFTHSPGGGIDCLITWYIQGESVLVSRGGLPLQETIPKISFMGARTKPMVIYGLSEIDVFSVCIRSHAFSTLTGIKLQPLVDQVVSFEDLELSSDWIEMSKSVLMAPSHGERIKIFEEFVDVSCMQRLREDWPTARRFSDIAKGLALRAATSKVGTSTRQIERKFRSWSGLTFRDLRVFGRAEQAFLDFRHNHQSGIDNWDGFSEKHFFSDHPHICREAKRLSGLSPEDLIRAVQTKESFWIYRLWR